MAHPKVPITPHYSIIRRINKPASIREKLGELERGRFKNMHRIFTHHEI